MHLGSYHQTMQGTRSPQSQHHRPLQLHSRSLLHKQGLLFRVRSTNATDTQVAVDGQSHDQTAIPPGCSRYSISVRKPLGLVLEQNKETLNIYVAELNPEGNAAKTGLVSVGDQLIATSGVTYSSEEDYNGAKVKKGLKVVRMNVMGQAFKTVSAAIGSHPGHMEVKMEFQRCGQQA